MFIFAYVKNLISVIIKETKCGCVRSVSSSFVCFVPPSTSNNRGGRGWIVEGVDMGVGGKVKSLSQKNIYAKKYSWKKYFRKKYFHQ